MIPFVLGTAAGYVLGARAGRERYEQLARTYRRVADNPAVQGAAGVAKAKVVDAVKTRRVSGAWTASPRDRSAP